MKWRDLPPDGRIAEIKRVWRPGMSAAMIAIAIDPALSRNAIIGMYSRHAAKLVACPLNPHGGIVRHPRKPLPTFRIMPGSPHTVGLPISHLPRVACRFPVADGLFCGVRGEHPSWCDHHRGVVYVRQEM